MEIAMGMNETLLTQAVRRLDRQGVAKYAPLVTDINEVFSEGHLIPLLGEAILNIRWMYGDHEIPDKVNDAVHILDMLVGEDININYRNAAKETILHMSIRHLDIAWAAIANSVDLNAVDESGWTALTAACYGARSKRDDFPLVHALLKAGADPNWTGADNEYTEGITPLMACCDIWDDVDSYKLIPTLVNYGADIDFVDCEGLNAFDHAVLNDNMKAAEILMSYNTGITHKTRELLREAAESKNGLSPYRHADFWGQIFDNFR